jgi:hypothetical protein
LAGWIGEVLQQLGGSRGCILRISKWINQIQEFGIIRWKLESGKVEEEEAYLYGHGKESKVEEDVEGTYVLWDEGGFGMDFNRGGQGRRRRHNISPPLLNSSRFPE